MTFKIEVTYAPGHTQAHEGLSAEQAMDGAYAFASDLVHLQGTGVKKLVVEVEEEP